MYFLILNYFAMDFLQKGDNSINVLSGFARGVLSFFGPYLMSRVRSPANPKSPYHTVPPALVLNYVSVSGTARYGIRILHFVVLLYVFFQKISVIYILG